MAPFQQSLFCCSQRPSSTTNAFKFPAPSKKQNTSKPVGLDVPTASVHSHRWRSTIRGDRWQLTLLTRRTMLGLRTRAHCCPGLLGRGGSVWIAAGPSTSGGEAGLVTALGQYSRCQKEKKKSLQVSLLFGNCLSGSAARWGVQTWTWHLSSEQHESVPCSFAFYWDKT